MVRTKYGAVPCDPWCFKYKKILSIKFLLIIQVNLSAIVISGMGEPHILS
ncbi:hypothetical protein [Synechococcus sp. C9]|nr:hypothetical protein [Synechococcus sp. C9]